jgi:hypothetical protein
MPKLAANLMTVAAATLSLASGAAAIECRDGYQLVAGGQISTPYCRDRQLAEVARAYGMRVSFAEIRSNPNAKKDVCRFIGRDIRVATTCLEVGGSGRRF